MMVSVMNGMARVPSLVIAFLFSSVSGSLIAGPPRIDIPSIFPGDIAASASTRWIGPYVLFQNTTIQGKQSNRITWYSEDGNMIKEITGPRLEEYSDCILDYRGETLLVYSIYDSSVIRIPLGGRTDSHICGMDYGKYFYQQYSTEKGTFTDLYFKGKYLRTYGPHCKSMAGGFNISAWGSIAYTLLDTMAECHCRIVATDSLGKETFSFEPDGPFMGITPSLTGDCVIINRGSNDFACFFSSGDIVRANLLPNDRLVGWVPNTQTMIISTAMGEDNTYSLLDWRTGKLVWSVPDPLEYMPIRVNDGVAISRDYFILSGLAIRESIAHGPVIPNGLKGTIRMLAAINIEKGELVAKWYEPTFRGRWTFGTDFPPMPNRGGDLFWYENQLYHITDINFSRISFEDIKNLKNGWVCPADSGTVHNDVAH